MTAAQNADSQSAMTPDSALEMLLAGNQRFSANARDRERDLLQQVEATRGGQWPYAFVLSCIDSRVSPELVFDTGIGDIFSARVAGNFINTDILGSMEYACKVAGTMLVVVMGHTHCGAVKGACDHAELGNLTEMLTKIDPAVVATEEPSDSSQRTSANADFVQRVARKNVELNLDLIRERSSVMSELEESGAVRIVGAMYDVESGAVELL